ncbi:hypothetical protein BJX70DRAFT_115601 [Aspergillus crustosus]
MAPTATRHWVLSEKPTGHPVISGPNATFQLGTKLLPQIQEGEVLVKVLYFSNDPAQRIWIDPRIPPDRLYTTPVEEGQTMASSAAVAEVIESESESLPVGTLISAMTGWSEYAVVRAGECIPLVPVDGLEVTDWAGLFGTAGVTAYYGLVDIVQAGPSDAVVISGAAGAVGSAAVQIAKNMLGCKRVIGIAGTDEKCRWVESLGADLCLNYKKTSFKDDLRKTTEGFVEVFFDNTGGEILDLMLELVKRDGRVAACGAITDYNSPDAWGIKNWYHVIAMRLQIQGFVVLDALVGGRWSEITGILIEGYQQDKLRVTDNGTTVVATEFEDIPKTWMRLFEGQSTGKLLTKLVKSVK